MRLPAVCRVTFLLVTAALVVAGVGACGSSPPSAQSSENWSGMAVIGGRHTTVSAVWRQPAIEFVVGATPTTFDFWVGFGAINSHQSEQIGARCRFAAGVISYSAWYDMHPKPNVPIKLVVRAGDLMAASVTNRGHGAFVLTISDRTTGHAFTTTQIDRAATCDSAEVIGQWPLADQASDAPASATVHFTECLVDRRPIGLLDPTSIFLDNYFLNGIPSDLGPDKASFSIALRPT
jgi:hypothetical protein